MANYGENGYIDFSKLWTVMDKKELNKQWLKNNGIHSNTVAKLTKNENVTCEVICNLCRLLNCQPGQIMEYKNILNTRKQTIDKYTKIDYNYKCQEENQMTIT